MRKKKTSEDIILLLSTSFRGELPQDIADYLLPPAEKHLIFDTTLRVNLLQRHGNERIPVKNETAY